jgi:hypothetical protein
LILHRGIATACNRTQSHAKTARLTLGKAPTEPCTLQALGLRVPARSLLPYTKKYGLMKANSVPAIVAPRVQNHVWSQGLMAQELSHKVSQEELSGKEINAVNLG